MMITVLTWEYLQNIPQPINYEQISRRDRGQWQPQYIWNEQKKNDW